MIRHGCKYPTCKINASLCDEVTVPSIDPRARWVSRTSPSAGTNPTASVILLSYPSNSIATIVSIGYRVHLRLSWRCKLLPPFFATPSLLYVQGGALHYRLFALITEYQPCRFDFFFFIFKRGHFFGTPRRKQHCTHIRRKICDVYIYRLIVLILRR